MSPLDFPFRWSDVCFLFLSSASFHCDAHSSSFDPSIFIPISHVCRINNKPKRKIINIDSNKSHENRWKSPVTQCDATTHELSCCLCICAYMDTKRERKRSATWLERLYGSIGQNAFRKNCFSIWNESTKANGNKWKRHIPFGCMRHRMVHMSVTNFSSHQSIASATAKQQKPKNEATKWWCGTFSFWRIKWENHAEPKRETNAI